ncbi:MAG TPA: lysozyme [Solirubrobacteraceae bacterium]|nr:lysozyme [Solirubrobacteraceae bacterium]
MARWAFPIAVVLALLAAPSVAAGAPSQAAPCATAAAHAAATHQRDCTIRGTISGRWNDTQNLTVTWHGDLVLTLQTADPYTGQSLTQITYAPAAGSTVDWQVSGTTGECSDSGSGTLNVSQLVGDLTLTKPQNGQWVYDLGIQPKPSGTMPYTEACPRVTNARDASIFDGMAVAYNSYLPGQAASNVLTDGQTFTGQIHTQTGNQDWAWSLKGEVFPQDISEHGIALIKHEEGLRLHAYEDQLHLCTIGYGHLILPEGRCGHRASMHWTHAEADQALRHDLDTLMEPYVRKASIKLGMNQCEYDALTSFAYNVAHGKGGESASWRQLMVGLDPATQWQFTVMQRLPTFVYGRDAKTGKRVQLPDLVKRRSRELHMFMAQKCPCDGVAA